MSTQWTQGEVYEYFITSHDNQSRTIIAENGSINGDPAEPESSVL